MGACRLKTDIEFFLPSDPGGKDSEGNNVNQGLNGKDLVFEFTGDDDVWVFVDDILVYNVSKLEVVTSLEGFDPAEKEMKLILSDEVSDETLEKNLITLEGNGKTIPTKLVGKNGRTVTLQLSEHLEYNTEYSLQGYSGFNK